MRMEVRKESPIAEGPTQLTTFFPTTPNSLPKSPLITKPIAGNRGINQTYSSMKDSFYLKGSRILGSMGSRVS
jgi:hypothetical protein